ncbi:centrosomal protein cep290 [Drosophila ficusphila]|uniref:centrosomal protein cep290 n=1 Tax=Drosophila ficusphila TaxID=30025 RepID=UPI0007E83196|nr:centrosomal protein cep290 [Drosophila ficusphila]
MSMDIPETVSLRKFRDFSARQKQELYETLLELAESIEELPKKSLRKTLELTLAVLEYKGEQVQRLQEQTAGGGGGTSDRRLQDENEKLKRMLQKLEDERDGLKTKSKELGEEIRQLELRLREAAQQAEASDKDSSDPLSELDKQEQLLQNIDSKNKHIKRLLKEIETLQNQNIAQSKTIVLHERELQNIKANLVQLSQDITKVEQERKCLKQKEQLQGLEIARLEGNVTFLEVEREKQELEMRQFLDKYETKALGWRQELEDREKEVERLRKQLEGKSISSVQTTSSSSQSQQEEEHVKLRHLLECREQQIEKLEARLKSMAEEMVTSTKVMNQLCLEKERSQDPEQPRACCQMIEERLQVANARSQQLSEMLEAAEQDNVLKSKQALHALSALECYKRGEDGLIPALRRCSGLEQKLAAREKQLRTYIQELNSLHEVVQENELLRRRLKIPDDVVILAKNVHSKQRNKDKQIERLTLKLRTSEELRLQLKLDKSELRRKLLELQPDQPQDLDVSLQPPSEVGEVPASAPLENSPRRGQGDGAASSEMQNRYDEVLAENETLRSGMYEILEKLREYDATSEHITIDSELLRRLIEALPSGTATPQRLQGQLQELKAREEALRQLLQQQNYSESETGELSSVQSLCDVPEMPDEHPEDVNPIVNTATRPSSPTEATEGLMRPVIPDPETEPKSEVLAELSILRKHYEELRLHMSADGSELLNQNQQLHDKLISLELQLEKQENSYSYMRRDYDELLSRTRKQEVASIEDKAALARQLEEKKSELLDTQNQLEEVKRRNLYTAEEQQKLEQRNAILSMQLAQAVEQLLGELKPSEICAEYGIIKDNYQLDYVTAEEFENQKQELVNWKSKQAELQRETKNLEGLLQIANGQIHSQQKLLNEITDNHINLRHLVADLQSSSDEKLMLAKVQRDLDSAKADCSRLETEREQLQQKADSLQTQLFASELSLKQAQQDFQKERTNSDIKHKFLQHSLFMLKDKYAKFTPLVFLTNFVFAYQKFQRRLEEEQVHQGTADHTALVDEVTAVVQAKMGSKEESSQQLVKLIKSETQTRLLEQRCEILQTKQEELLRELSELRLRQATETEHWSTIQALFGEGVTPTQSQSQSKVDAETNTDAVTPIPAMRRAAQLIDRQSSPIGSPLRKHPPLDTATQTQEDSVKLSETAVQTNGILGQQNQAVQTADAVEETKRDSHLELQKMQETLQEANQRIEVLGKQLEASRSESRESESPHSGVVEKTILSFHTLLLEKDQSIQKYQDLLQTERDQNQQAISKQAAENESLRATVNNLNFNIKTKDAEIQELKGKLEQQPQKPKAVLERTPTSDSTSSSESSVNELTDEKIEELFESSSVERPHEEVEVHVAAENPVIEEPEGEEEKQDTEELKELPTLHKQIRELKDKLEYSEKNLKTREEEVEILKEKLKLCQEREKSVESTVNPELDQLRIFLDEKDKHIKDLMDTLKNFHDDQQRYIKDTSNFSEDQIAKLAADLNRTEATNKIYHTQMEALRRQLANVTQREKQARDLSQSLRQQLLKRPVVSIKTELNARVKNENQQKRIQQLEADLDEARGQLQRQQTLLEAKRTRSANEVQLWEKQKRYQQQAEKTKARLEETELALDKTRSLLQAARTTIARLEKDKQIMESKLGRNGPASNGSGNTLKCCRTPSCPNLQHVGVGNKFTPSPSESPETYTGPSSECSSPAHRSQPPNGHFFDQSQVDLIEALKSRIELQQRKIIAMELEGRGSNALTTELEKMQERCQAIEAQNIRLEARNLQLQLDSDLLRQGDSSDRLQKRIKHLEDYILALKEEMARNESRRELCKCSGLKVNTNQGQSAEQTILSLRNLVEKLRSENKFLKDGRRSTESRSSTDSTPPEAARLQQQNAEAMEKIAALQQELQKRTKCSQCGGRSKDAANEELKFIKEQLVKKTQLLQKAKVLLTRAAAKEKVLREQLALWKRKCSELQNVPVIDEISE